MNKQPSPDYIYIYSHIVIWDDMGKPIETIKIDDVMLPVLGLLVHDIVLTDFNECRFKFIGNDTEFVTPFGWHFYENTEEGREAYNHRRAFLIELESIKTDIMKVLKK